MLSHLPSALCPATRFGAGDGTRTHDLLLGKEAFYQLNYARLCSAEGRNRTGDTRIFSPLLYQLSYLGAFRLAPPNFTYALSACQGYKERCLPNFLMMPFLGL